MSTYSRCGNKWTVSELIALQREYELLEMSVEQIALKHQRSVKAILFKIESEGFTNDSNNVFLEYKTTENEVLSELSQVDDIDKLTERIWNLETNVADISSMVKQMFDNMVITKTKKLAPLRKTQCLE